MATPRSSPLYHDDSKLFSFRGVVIAHETHAGRPSVLLDRTAFYPESGGQMADRGRLDEAAVVDVQVDDEGRIHHVLEGPLPAIGAEVSGSIDKPRRLVHMAQHTGQHMLSRALADVARAETVSSRLGESACTIDLDVAALDERAVAEAEALVNAVIDDDAPIRAFFPSEDELRALPLRRQPKVHENVRVVAIGDFDVSPCGGTHCTNTAQVGFVRIDGLERYKGKMRVTFSAGVRARTKLSREADVVRALARELTCGPEDVPAGIEKLRRELDEARQALGRVRGRVAGAIAEALVKETRARGERAVIGVIEDASLDLVRAVAGRITAEGDLVALLAGEADGGTIVLAARGPSSDFDCGAFLKRAATAAGGRGGGRPERAEGRLPAGIDWKTIAAATLAGLGR
ncbi:alanyl-tRNA editing protein [Polyangium sp. 15x6]|uniref:alanyl-tRNA editing protein n=1 Tax=Polyangium sp. 15x6 TaxID=3042687 RepID=UPI00249A7C68|nr:alanyl-tRNA editing protein [Polyangium sp. 15x6]MDI3285279.1 alanyl-tRNA editing protein [Polyangium sp. 15x6]